MVVAKRKTRAVTLKLDSALYQEITDISVLTKFTIRELVEQALFTEVRLQYKKRVQLKGAVENMHDFRLGSASTPRPFTKKQYGRNTAPREPKENQTK